MGPIILGTALFTLFLWVSLAALNNTREQLRRTQHENRVLKRFLGK